MSQPLHQLESIFFRALNQLAEPLIRRFRQSRLLADRRDCAGNYRPEDRTNLQRPAAGYPHRQPFDCQYRSSPLAMAQQPCESSPYAIWLGGRLHEASAFVMTPGIGTPSFEGLMLLGSYLAGILIPQTQLLGICFAILATRRSHEKVV